MALFNKKKSQTPAATPANTATASSGGDDFSDFSPEALDSTAVAVAAEDTSKKGRKAAAAREKKNPSGRAIKPGVSIGLNIGSDSIKAIELQAKGNEMTITGIGMVPTPSESISNGVVMSANALVSGIRDAMMQAGIKSKRVVTSVSGTGALVVRIIEVPKMSDGELEDNMKMDADRYIPFPPSEVIMDFTALRELPSDPDSANMEVLLAAAQREVIDLHVQVLQDAKLDPRSIDVEPLAAARALTHPLTNGAIHPGAAANGAALEAEIDYNDVAAILNVGASGTEISILRGDILVFTRTVPTGGNTLTQSLVDTLGLAWSDAEQLKREMGDALPPSESSAPVYAAPDADQNWGEENNNADTFAVDNAEELWGDFGDADSEENAGDPNMLDQNGEYLPDDAAVGNTPTAASGDPFSDDFYEQGPNNVRQSEPGEQHQQKEPGSASPFDFGNENSPANPEQTEAGEIEAGKLPTYESEPIGTEDINGGLSTLDAGEDAILPSASAPEPIPSAAPASPASNADAFDAFGATASTPATPSSPVSNPFFDFGEEVDEPEDKLPTIKDGSPVSFADFLHEDEDDFSNLPTLSTNTQPATVPSAFDFPGEGLSTLSGLSTPGALGSDDVADFSLPTFVGETSATEQLSGSSNLDTQEESLLPSSEPKTSGGSNAFSFSFEDSLLATPEPAPATPPASAVETDPFAEFMATTEAAPAESRTAAPISIEKTAAPATAAAGLSTPAPAVDDDFDLDSLFGDTAAAPSGATGDALDMSGTDFSDDFAMDDAAFGVGLAGASVGEIDAQTLHGVIEPVLENLVNEVRRSLEYHTTRYPDAAVRRVVLIGGGAKLTNLDAFFTQKLGIPATVGNPVARLAVRATNLPAGYIEQSGPMFTVALGLAMRELTR